MEINSLRQETVEAILKDSKIRALQDKLQNLVMTSMPTCIQRKDEAVKLVYDADYDIMFKFLVEQIEFRRQQIISFYNRGN